MAQYVEEPDHLALAAEHLSELRRFAEKLNEISGRVEEEGLERNLHGALEAAMAAGSHVLMRLDVDLPNRYAQIFTALATQGVISSELAGKMRELEEVHDILVHGSVTPEALHEQAHSGPLFLEFAHSLAKFLEINI